MEIPPSSYAQGWHGRLALRAARGRVHLFDSQHGKGERVMLPRVRCGIMISSFSERRPHTKVSSSSRSRRTHQVRAAHRCPRCLGGFQCKTQPNLLSFRVNYRIPRETTRSEIWFILLHSGTDLSDATRSQSARHRTTGTFDDIVRSPHPRPTVYAEWTDLNDQRILEYSHPGVRLAQRNADLPDEQIPDLNYLKFLELIGIETQSGSTAQKRRFSSQLRSQRSPNPYDGSCRCTHRHGARRPPVDRLCV